MSTDPIQTIRRFNRTVSHCIGALENSYLARGRPLAEARLIYEIGPGGDDVQAIRNRLGLDSGYLSRLLRSLEGQALVSVAAPQDDRRRRIARLTDAGLAEFAAYEALSDRLAASMINPLEPSQQARLLAAMTEAERLIRAASVTLETIAPDHPDARFCLEAYFRELAERFETGFDPANSNPAPEESLVPPFGCLVIARLGREPAGCGALKRLSEDAGEVKRMWTAPSARGLGIARRILRRLETTATALGLKILRLETNRSLIEAQALYRSEGFREVPAFNREPYAHHWFQKELSSAISSVNRSLKQ